MHSTKAAQMTSYFTWCRPSRPFLFGMPILVLPGAVYPKASLMTSSLLFGSYFIVIGSRPAGFGGKARVSQQALDRTDRTRDPTFGRSAVVRIRMARAPCWQGFSCSSRMVIIASARSYSTKSAIRYSLRAVEPGRDPAELIESETGRVNFRFPTIFISYGGTFMSAQRTSQTLQPVSRGGAQRGQQRSLARRVGRGSSLPSIPSLLLDPLGFFPDAPFFLLKRVQQEVNRVFSRPEISNLATRGDDIASTGWVPPVKLEVHDGKLIVSAELPGLDDKDITVEVRDDALVISGEREGEQEQDLGGMRRTERQYGQFYRAIPLPDGADPRKATAVLEDGVLRIEIPVNQEASEVQRIPIQGSATNRLRKKLIIPHPREAPMRYPLRRRFRLLQPRRKSHPARKLLLRVRRRPEFLRCARDNLRADASSHVSTCRPNIQVLIFDLDETLVDSVTSVCWRGGKRWSVAESNSRCGGFTAASG